VNRTTAIVAGAIVFLAIFFALAGESSGMALYRLLQDGGCAIFWLLAAGGIGWVAWKGIGTRENCPPSLAVVTTTALGLGIISLLILSLGLARMLNEWVAVGIVTVGDLIAISVLWGPAKNWDAAAWLRGPVGWGWLWIVATVVAGVVMLAACFPPGLLWGDEPNGYDVVEYHLQIPREWFEAGHIIPLHHNVFSYFPFNLEMHYLLAMYFHGGWWGPWAGMYLAQMMHVSFCALAVWAVYALAGGGKRGLVAALLVAGVPWTGLLAPVAYVEGGTLLFGVLAIGWALRAKSFRELLIAGMMAGFAAGTKASIVPLVFIGVPIVVLIRAGISAKLRVGGAACYLLAGILVYSPWLVRNSEWAGNPVFPEEMSLLGRGHFSQVQAERWREAYWPDRDHRGAVGRARGLWEQVIGDWRYGFVLLPIGVAATVIGWRNRTVVCLVVLLVFQMVFWLCFTHLQSRFMVIIIPIIALLAAQNENRRWVVSCAAVGVLLSIFSVGMLIDKLGRYLELDRKLAVIGRENLTGFAMFDARILKDHQSLNLVGEAEVFWYQIPMSRLHYKTVFDVDTRDPNESIEAAWLSGMPPDGVVWRDVDELKRFSRTYYGIKSPSDNP
jgi:4-amino-4-deoxy-L-arabinose transferase-like glycosyltransferase